MCGRYTIITKLKVIEKSFQVDISGVENLFEPNVNVCPGDPALIITNKEPNKVQISTFGVPLKIAGKSRMIINARSEGDHNKDNDPNYTGAKGIIEKRMFQKPIRSQRCLVLADAFVEGPEKEKLNKPYLIFAKDKKRPFAMAGLWFEWPDTETGELEHRFVIVTTVPNDLLMKVGHHRSPVVLREEDEKRWLRNDLPLSELTSLLHPFDHKEYNAYPISPEIKSPKNKDVSLLKPVGENLYKEYDYILYQELELQGMGETTARKKRNGEQGSLFD